VSDRVGFSSRNFRLSAEREIFQSWFWVSRSDISSNVVMPKSFIKTSRRFFSLTFINSQDNGRSWSSTDWYDFKTEARKGCLPW
jgi:hypothetical protein